MAGSRGGRLYALILAARAGGCGNAMAQAAGAAPAAPAPAEAALPRRSGAPAPGEAPALARRRPAGAVEATAVAPSAASPSATTAPAAPDAVPAAAPEAATPGGSGTAAAAPDAVAPADPGEAPAGTNVSAAELPVDLSPWNMFQNADIVVKAVMAGLALASLVTWTVLVAKSLEILGASRRLRGDLARILTAKQLAAAAAALGDRRGPAAAMVHAAAGEDEATMGVLDDGPQGLQPRISSHLSRIEAGAGRRLTIGIGVLATIGATAPFVGLFGTVWGIMNSFIGISRAQTTNLAVVAPGIAEALLAPRSASSRRSRRSSSTTSSPLDRRLPRQARRRGGGRRAAGEPRSRPPAPRGAAARPGGGVAPWRAAFPRARPAATMSRRSTRST